MKIDPTRDRLVYATEPRRPGGKPGTRIEVLSRRWGKGHVPPYLFRRFLERENLSNSQAADFMGIGDETVRRYKIPAGQKSRKCPRHLFWKLVKASKEDWQNDEWFVSTFAFIK